MLNQEQKVDCTQQKTLSCAVENVTEQKATRTPTPWYVYEDDNLKICGQNEINEVIGATWPYKTAAIFDHQGRVYNEHDAAHIVHCVNTHEALKASHAELLLCVKAWNVMYEDKSDVPPEARLHAYMASVKAITNAESLT